MREQNILEHETVNIATNYLECYIMLSLVGEMHGA
jgi:hypothetical protein